jgi:hypothetical protein
MFGWLKKKDESKENKLVRRYIHTKGYFKLSGKSPRKKNANFIRNRIILAVLIVIFMAPGIYFCFF